MTAYEALFNGCYFYLETIILQVVSSGLVVRLRSVLLNSKNNNNNYFKYYIKTKQPSIFTGGCF